MNTNEYLEGVLREQTLAPGGPELKELQQVGNEVRDVLCNAYGDAARIREGGSKAKRTMIKASYDLDLSCYFGRDEAVAGESLKEIYEYTAGVLAGKYTIQRKGSAIRLLGLKSGSDLHVDVVPGRFVDGEEGDVFLCCSSGDKERLKTNLDVHIEHVRDSGVREPIRLMKFWRSRSMIVVKTFGLELLVIKLLQGIKTKPLADQLLHVWQELRDHSDTLSVEDPANPSGNDLSELLSPTVRAQLSSSARSTLQTIDQSGWEGVFGKLETSEEDRAAAIGRIAVATPSKTKPWSYGS